MESRRRPEEYPLWVKIGLWGLRSRASVWAFVWFSVACAAAGCAYGLLADPRGFGAAGFLLAALMYWLAIRWVDRHGRWPE